MNLGAFSISLAVKDIKESKTFYEKLGFSEFKGGVSHKWVIMKNGDAVIGLFEKMFDENIITFNPGWDQDSNSLDSFTDIREIKDELEKNGIKILYDNVEKEGPCSFMLNDPDGNIILIDQHI